MRDRLTYANVMSTLALFMALGLGGAYAADKITSKDLAKNSVTSKAIKNKTVAGKDVKDGTLSGAKVQDESLGASDVTDGSIGSAEVTNGAVGAADLAPDEPFHVVGAPGEPAFGNGGDGDCIWQNGLSAYPKNPVSFYKTNDGIVRLAGLAAAFDGVGGDGLCDTSEFAEQLADYRIFTLPPGYRPANPERIVTGEGNGTNVTLIIGGTTDFSIPETLPAGAVVVTAALPAPLQVNLDGLSFRAAGSGGGLTGAATKGTGDDSDSP